MSWFDAAGLANIAKSALKEAQRTIDKALDIQDDNETSQHITSVDTNLEDVQHSVWGSFTGSFFDGKSAKACSIDSLLDDSNAGINQHFDTSKLVVVQQTTNEDSQLSMAMSTVDDSVKSDTAIIENSNLVVESEDVLKSYYTSNNNTEILNIDLIDMQPQSINHNFERNYTNIIDIPKENEESPEEKNNTSLIEQINDDDETHSDKTLMQNSNNDETNNNANDVKCDTNSMYLKNLLEDAMTEKKLIPSNTPSQHSSESPFDLVKISSNSDRTTSDADEMDEITTTTTTTTTSSDIEIISSPNCDGRGDSSSTQSVTQSPIVKLISKEIVNLKENEEITTLIKRITEMTQMLETREIKINDLNRKCIETDELNVNLKLQLDTITNKQLQLANVEQITDEYTQRLSVLEKKLQQVISEKDVLKKQLDQSKQENATKLSKTELEVILCEKDEAIKELREEGEKLSKQQLQHSTIIKKLRTKEKENETTMKQLKDTIDEISIDNERMKRNLQAKDELERTQIDAIHQLTARNKKYETDLQQLRNKCDDLGHKYETTKQSLDLAKKELEERNKATENLQLREIQLENIEMEKSMIESQNQEFIEQLENLRLQFSKSELEFSKKEQQLRKENKELLKRLEETEMRNEELSQTVLEVGKPLLRQLEQLQANHTMKCINFEKNEQEMSLKLSDLQTKLQTYRNSEKTLKEECLTLKTNLMDLDEKYHTLKNECEVLRMQLEQKENESQIVKSDLKRKIEQLDDKYENERKKVGGLMSDINSLQQQLSEKKKINELMNNRQTSGSNSPTLSLGKMSNADSLNGSFWSQDDGTFDVTASTSVIQPRYTNLFEMQILQSNLKQREGEVQQLQWELNRREQERTILNTEISMLLNKVEGLQSNEMNLDELKIEFDVLQKQYDTLCQLFGEKVEENEELKLDLQDVKDMYKSQIDELLKQQQLKIA